MQNSIAQSNKNDSIFIFIDKETKYIYSTFSKDSSSVNFCIYLKKYETKALRETAKKKYRRTQKELYPLPPLRKPLEFCIVATSVSNPIKLDNINSIEHITPEEFRDGNYYSRYMYVIYKIRNNYYLKWRIFIGV
jgi:hypothetical protein